MYTLFFKICKDVEVYNVIKGLENPQNLKIEKNIKMPKYLLQLMNP
jgi:hypothetical protein|tara:strand:- start:1500 stop:1637 length:138 start_codon:yes stop_codon:yes gene_type:complete